MRTIPSRFLGEIQDNLLEKKYMSRLEMEGFGKTKKRSGFGEDGEKVRVVVQDWEIEKETKDDFDDVDNW